MANRAWLIMEGENLKTTELEKKKRVEATITPDRKAARLNGYFPIWGLMASTGHDPAWAHSEMFSGRMVSL